jgi:hypothetical protein
VDINAALARMRELVSAPHATDSESDMAMVFEAIDGWLSKGESKPSAWS